MLRSTPVDGFRLAYRIVPATILWPELDPLFPLHWSDRLDDFFTNATLHALPGVGHFSPLEAPEQFASAIRDVLSSRGDSNPGGPCP
jgi:pimeloyl-ACP methyl ester carboxylesterase